MSHYYIILTSLLISFILVSICSSKIINIRTELVSHREISLQVVMLVYIVSSVFFNMDLIIGVLIYLGCILQSSYKNVQIEKGIVFASAVIVANGVILNSNIPNPEIIFLFVLSIFSNLLFCNEKIKLQFIKNFYTITSLIVICSQDITHILWITAIFILSEIVSYRYLKNIMKLGFVTLNKLYSWSLQLFLVLLIVMEYL